MKNINIETMERALDFLRVYDNADTAKVLAVLDPTTKHKERFEAGLKLAQDYQNIATKDIMALIFEEDAPTYTPATPAEKKPRYHKPANKRPKKAGKRWTDADIELLQVLQERGTSIERMANILGRTDKAIKIALFKQRHRTK